MCAVKVTWTSRIDNGIRCENVNAEIYTELRNQTFPIPLIYFIKKRLKMSEIKEINYLFIMTQDVLLGGHPYQFNVNRKCFEIGDIFQI